MVVHQCDRCKRIFERNTSISPKSGYKLIKDEIAISRLDGQVHNVTNVVDLCDKCKEDLEEWFRSPETKDLDISGGENGK